MAQGDSLRDLHVWNVGQEWYVDAVNGNDSTGTGAIGAPYQTLQKMADELAANKTWVSLGQDVRVNILNGTYQASGVGNTLLTAFSNSARAPASNRYLIWAAVNPGLAVVRNPNQATGEAIAIEVGSNALNSYQIFYGLDFDGQQVRRGTGLGASEGIYFSGNGANANTGCEVLRCKIHGFRAVSGAGNTAEGLFAEEGATFLILDRCEFYDIGEDDGDNVNQEHGIYIQAADVQITNSIFRNNPNGYGAQFYNGGTATTPRLTMANCTLHHNNGAGILIHGDEDDVTFKNLIITDHYQRGNSSWGIEFFPAGAGGSTNCVLDRVIYCNNYLTRSASPAGWTFTNELDVDPELVTQPPRVIGKGTAAQVTTGTVAPTLPAPAGGILANDVCFLLVINNQPVSIGVINTPATWNEAAQGTFQTSAPADAGRAALFWKRMSGGESGTVSVTTTGDTGADTVQMAQIYLVRDCVESGNPYDAVTADYGPGNATIDYGAVTVSGIERTLLAFVTQAQALTAGNLTRYNQSVAHDVTTAGTDAEMRLQSKAMPTSGAATTSTSGSTLGWATFHVSAKPRDPTGHADPDLRIGSALSPALGYTDTNYSFAYDFLGNLRPAGQEDAGAFEFPAATTTIRPRSRRAGRVGRR